MQQGDEAGLPPIDSLAGDFTARYEGERRRLTRRRIRTACLLATGIVPSYACIDFALYQPYFPTLLTLRIASVSLSLTILWLADRAVGRRAPFLLAHVLCVGAALINSGIPVFLLGYAVPYYVGFVIVVFGVALLLPWRPSNTAALLLSLAALYVVASAAHGGIGNWALFACNVSFIGATIGIALVSMGAGEELRDREFRARIALEEAFNSKNEVANALADKTAKLESLNQEMEDLLYVASHDLRAPLINVQGFSREVQLGLTHLRSHNGRSPETNAVLTDVDESLQFILTGVARMDALIASLLNVSRIVTRTNPTEQVDLDVLVRRVAESFDYQLTEANITLTMDSLPVVTGDAVRLGQVFGNLIDNAIKYMDRSSERRIHVGVRLENDEPRFFVKDTGSGIAAAQHEQIFRLFRRLASRDCPGEGIGLTMVRKIVEKHGGRIWVDSTPGHGSTFWFTLKNPTLRLELGGAQ